MQHFSRMLLKGLRGMQFDLTPPRRYVSGDPRFKSYSKSNPRKMVKMWAEKELRNLARLHAAGIRCPKPLQLRTHVLVMEFIGQQGVAALRLKVLLCLKGGKLPKCNSSSP